MFEVIACNDPKFPYPVIDPNGDIVALFHYESDAENYAAWMNKTGQV